MHPACEAFPPVSEEELRTTGEDIKARGLEHPVDIWTGPDDDDGNEDDDKTLYTVDILLVCLLRIFTCNKALCLYVIMFSFILTTR